MGLGPAWRRVVTGEARSPRRRHRRPAPGSPRWALLLRHESGTSQDHRVLHCAAVPALGTPHFLRLSRNLLPCLLPSMAAQPGCECFDRIAALLHTAGTTCQGGGGAGRLIHARRSGVLACRFKRLHQTHIVQTMLREVARRPGWVIRRRRLSLRVRRLCYHRLGPAGRPSRC